VWLVRNSPLGHRGGSTPPAIHRRDGGAQGCTSCTVGDQFSSVRPARRENRGQAGYWYGHRRREGRLRKVYLGRAADLTAERLQEAAELLADGWSDESGLSGAWRRGEGAQLFRRLRENAELRRQRDPRGRPRRP
jgi:hypothetical protein